MDLTDSAKRDMPPRSVRNKIRNITNLVLGDNRDNTIYSRMYGFIQKDRVFAQTLFIYFSWDSNTESIGEKLRIKRIGL